MITTSRPEAHDRHGAEPRGAMPSRLSAVEHLAVGADAEDRRDHDHRDRQAADAGDVARSSRSRCRCATARPAGAAARRGDSLPSSVPRRPAVLRTSRWRASGPRRRPAARHVAAALERRATVDQPPASASALGACVEVVLRDHGQLLRVRADVLFFKKSAHARAPKPACSGHFWSKRAICRSVLDGVDLLRRDVPADGEGLAPLPGLLDRAGRVAGADVDVLDHVDVLAGAGQERLVGVVASWPGRR